MTVVLRWLHFIAVAVGWFWLAGLAFMPAFAPGADAAECPGPRAPGWRPTEDELKTVRAAHGAWVKSGYKSGCRAEMSNADLIRANLSGALLVNANLSDARLEGADLIVADLIRANLSGADLRGANLSGAHLFHADLSRALLVGANLRGAILVGADLSGADLDGAKLSRATLGGANLNAARLVGADLSGADLFHAHLTDARFEPSSVDGVRNLETASGLSTLRFGDESGPTVLVLVRDDFRKRGLHAQARELTHAIRRQERKHAWQRRAVIEAAFNYGFFEFTSGYGLDRGRPLYLLCGLVPAFSLLYMLALIRPGSRSGIWRVWSPDRVLQSDGQTAPVRLSAASGFGERHRNRAYRILRVIALGLYMSVLSAFHIGWRDLNVGTWIARMQPREYTLRPTGWVRVVSGVQSLISVYLVALWVLTYFGRPFD